MKLNSTKKRSMAQLALMRKSRGSASAPTFREPAPGQPTLTPQEALQERLEDRRLSAGWRARREPTRG